MNTESWKLQGYREISRIGKGSSGSVVVAIENLTNKYVAIKYLSSDLFHKGPKFITAFRAEAEVLRTLDSAHIVRIYDYAESPYGAAIVMEFVDGPTLREILNTQAPLQPEAALCILKGSLAGLSCAHKANIVHRDFKPENILISSTAGSSKLADFGIAIAGSTDTTTAGTPYYMAPEQWLGAAATTSADVYSATATFFECITGRKPFDGASLTELAVQHATAPLLLDAVPAQLRAVIERGMAKNPAERPSSADEFLVDLEKMAAGMYGSDWENRGRNFLALSALGIVSAITQSTSDPATSLAETSVAETRFSEKINSPGKNKASDALSAKMMKLGAGLIASAILCGISYHFMQNTAHPSSDSPPQFVISKATPDRMKHSEQPSRSPTRTGGASPHEQRSSASRSAKDLQTTSHTAKADMPSRRATRPSHGSHHSVPQKTEHNATKDTEVTQISAEMTVDGATLSAVSKIHILTSATGPVKVLISWYQIKEEGKPQIEDGESETILLSGKKNYSIDRVHAFQGAQCATYWGMEVGSENWEHDSKSAQTEAPACLITEMPK
ncbi:serine/threonine-protein kinase [Streptomyces sp. NPDC086783]|uniref:serine/threonine-protein kinase n=1 Tax=Streptomyces sp. NPDC086783 TaxID=3365758 RepID=UPI00380DAA4A